jgi:DNA topoisomerase-1
MVAEPLESNEAPASVHDLAAAMETAASAGLRYVSDAQPGISRERVGDCFRYRMADGTEATDARTLDRIARLAIPPAWQDVWICPSPQGHLQATGRDAKGRKQYRYHARWRAVRDETKYHRMLAFGEALPQMRERVAADLHLPGLPRVKVLAAMVALLDETAIRVGNEEYARENHSFGLTTLRNRHVDVHGTEIRLHFRGKSGKEHAISLRDRRLARVIQRCRDLPGQELFEYADADGTTHSITSDDVNDYLRAISGQDFTAKVFRTWAASVIVADALCAGGECASETEARHRITAAIKTAAAKLGNTPAICRKSYVHPQVLAAYLDGSLFTHAVPSGTTDEAPENEPHEATVLALLRDLEAAA